MMRYKNVDLTFDNYLTELSEFSQDVKDEVRSGILDNIPLGRYIYACADNPYRLQQIRLGMKECLDTDYLKLKSGDHIRRVRVLLSQDVRLDLLKEYTYLNLPSAYYDVLLDWIETGAVIPEDLELDKVNEAILPAISYAVLNDLNAVEIASQSGNSLEYAQSLLTMSALGMEIGELSGTKYQEEALEALSGIASRPYSSSVLRLMDRNSSGDYVDSLIALASSKFDLSELKETYSVYQLDWIYQAFTEGLDYTKILEPGLSNTELSELYSELVLKRSKRLSMRL